MNYAGAIFFWHELKKVSDFFICMAYFKNFPHKNDQEISKIVYIGRGEFALLQDGQPRRLSPILLFHETAEVQELVKPPPQSEYDSEVPPFFMLIRNVEHENVDAELFFIPFSKLLIHQLRATILKQHLNGNGRKQFDINMVCSNRVWSIKIFLYHLFINI